MSEHLLFEFVGEVARTSCGVKTANKENAGHAERSGRNHVRFALRTGRLFADICIVANASAFPFDGPSLDVVSSRRCWNASESLELQLL